MNSQGLDELDEKILDAMKYDARISYEDIAKKVGVSRTAVKNRIQVMEENNIIIGYETRINRANVSHAIRFYVEIEAYPRNFQVILNYLGESAFIRDLYIASGSNHILALGLASNSTTLQAYANKLSRELDDVRKLTVCTIMSVCKSVDGGIEYVRYQESEHMEGEKKQ